MNPDQELGEYNGVKVLKYEWEVLKGLEEMIKEMIEEAIPIVSKIEWNTLGIKIDSNRVVGRMANSRTFQIQIMMPLNPSS
jgi:hypothetical protein